MVVATVLLWRVHGQIPSLMFYVSNIATKNGPGMSSDTKKLMGFQSLQKNKDKQTYRVTMMIPFLNWKKTN